MAFLADVSCEYERKHAPIIFFRCTLLLLLAGTKRLTNHKLWKWLQLQQCSASIFTYHGSQTSIDSDLLATLALELMSANASNSAWLEVVDVCMRANCVASYLCILLLVPIEFSIKISGWMSESGIFSVNFRQKMSLFRLFWKVRTEIFNASFLRTHL